MEELARGPRVSIAADAGDAGRRFAVSLEEIFSDRAIAVFQVIQRFGACQACKRTEGETSKS